MVVGGSVARLPGDLENLENPRSRFDGTCLKLYQASLIGLI